MKGKSDDPACVCVRREEVDGRNRLALYPRMCVCVYVGGIWRKRGEQKESGRRGGAQLRDESRVSTARATARCPSRSLSVCKRETRECTTGTPE